MDAVSDRDFVAELLVHRRPARGAPVAPRRGRRACGTRPSSAGSRSTDAFSHRQLDHAAEEEPGRRRAWPAGKAGRLIGHVTGVLAMLKGLPLAYDRDLQEAQEPCFGRRRHARSGAPGAHRDDRDDDRAPEVMAAGAATGFALATDVAELLVREGVPFAQAHEAVGAMVARCTERVWTCTSSPTPS